MDLSFSPEDAAFRDEVRRFIDENYPEGLKGKLDEGEEWSKEDYLSWHRILGEKGWVAPAWPTEYGGPGWNATQRYIFSEELARADTIPVLPFGINMGGPVIYTFGTEEQKARFLPRILSGEDWWCQGYSEPGAGSDLAAVRTRAQAEPGGFRLNGHKIWTSFADRAQWCFVLARTDPDAPRHKGLSFLLVDMRSAGVRVEPIRQITGEAEFCEVFFDDVFVPQDALLGELNQGWRIAMAAASFERGTYFIPRLVRFAQELRQVRELALQPDAHGRTPASSAPVRHRWARLAADSHVLALKSQRALAGAMRGHPPGPEGSSTKIHWSEAHQRLLELSLQLLGEDASLGVDAADARAAQLTHAYLWSRAETILAGTSEIQRNIIAEQMLGLPKA